MEFTTPSASGFTIYGKTDCPYCDKVKTLLTDYDETFTYINCDDYLVDNKEAFLAFIKGLAGIEHKTFPMVFSSKIFIGGYTDTIKLMLDKHE